MVDVTMIAGIVESVIEAMTEATGIDATIEIVGTVTAIEEMMIAIEEMTVTERVIVMPRIAEEKERKERDRRRRSGKEKENENAQKRKENRRRGKSRKSGNASERRETEGIEIEMMAVGIVTDEMIADGTTMTIGTEEIAETEETMTEIAETIETGVMGTETDGETENCERAGETTAAMTTETEDEETKIEMIAIARLPQRRDRWICSTPMLLQQLLLQQHRLLPVALALVATGPTSPVPHLRLRQQLPPLLQHLAGSLT